ncbi:MAG: trypsin-like peptidase domain-containing protein [Terracidiphilus sp.]|nr:trypsin-like peptidase domain-containing protein [Terracidiphilus sp.]
MTATTNSLIAKLKKFALPAASTAALVLGGALLFNHTAVHAASSANGSVPLDDASVSSLVALDNAVEAVAARVTPAVVNVSVTSKGSDEADDDAQGQDQGQDQDQGMQNIPPAFRFFFGPQGRGQQQQPQFQHGIGSGIILTPDGYILTNNHVVDGSVKINVTLDDRRVFPAKLIGTDKLNDLAVIKIDAKNLPTIAWGDSTQLHPGQTVLAFGSPFGYFQFSVTRGIVSALNRPNPYTDDPRKPGDFIQTDAAINPGNSGGPLVNAHGELIGINTFIISGSGSFAGAGFAIPSQIARASADSIIKTGEVHHGYLGITMNEVTPENAGFFNLPDATGALVAQVTPDSPAGHAGLKQGDVLRELNGKTIVNSSALQVAVSQINPGTVISLGILRDGKPETVKITVGEFHKDLETALNDKGGDAKRGKLGLTLQNLTPDIRAQLHLPDQLSGPAVAAVRPGSPAEDAGLTPGDIILEVNRKPVQSVENFADQVHNAPAGKDVLLLVWSRGGTTYRVVHAAQDKENGF